MTREQIGLKVLIRTYYSYEEAEKQLLGRLRLKNDLTPKKGLILAALPLEYRDKMLDSLVVIRLEKDKYKKMIESVLPQFPIWTEFLLGIKGVGPLLGGVNISFFDINVPYVSCWWQFGGLNPGLVRGWKSDGKDENGWPKWKQTDDLIRGDRLTPGYRSPFNKELRMFLCGRLATSFMRQKAYYTKFFYDNRTRLESEHPELKPGHRKNRATRYMIKMFLQDYFNAWREIEGLSVPPPYSEKYLGHKHNNKMADLLV